MGRPIKAGLDYFPHSCIPDQRMELIEAEFGLTGYAVILKLYETIFVEKGYYCEWTKDVALMFSRKNSVGVNVVSEIVNASLRRGIFDDDLFKKYSILTSKEIQEIYHEVTTKLNRKQVDFVKEYLLVDYTLFSDKYRIYSINSTGNAINYTGNAQKKRKESKRKEKKSNERSPAEQVIKLPCKNGEYAVEASQVEQLHQVYKNIDVMQSIRKIFDFLKANPERQRTLEAMDNYIIMWLSKDEAKALSKKKEEADNKSSNVSYDIGAFKKYDIFE